MSMIDCLDCSDMVLPFTREELKPFCIALEFEETPTTSGVPCNIALLDWYRSRKSDLERSLALAEMKPLEAHLCSRVASRSSMYCHYRTPNGHVVRSRRCPTSVGYQLGVCPTTYGEPKLSVAEEILSDDYSVQASLDALCHDFGSLDLRFPLSPYIMDGVLRGSATREQLWVLEGVLYRQLHIAKDNYEREAFGLMWAALHRAKTGFQAPFNYFHYLRLALDASSPAKRRMIRAAGFLDSDSVWVEFFCELNMVRSRWKNAADVVARVPHSTHLFPRGIANGEEGYTHFSNKLFDKRPSMPKWKTSSRDGFVVESNSRAEAYLCV